MVHGVSFYIDGAEGACGAEVFAFAATDTFLCIHYRYFDHATVDLLLHHLDCPRRAVTRTRAAVVAVGDGDAVLLNPHGVTDMDSSLLLFGNGFDSTRWAHLRATGTLRAAVTALERHLRLHEPQRVGRWPQHVIRTCTDA